MSIVHVAFYPSDWLAGTIYLSAEERGVYISLLARMYEAAGPIKRDDKRLHKLCGCTTKAKFVKSLNYLISEGKIIEFDGELFNDRAQKEIEKVLEKSSKAKAAAESKWRKKSNKFNGSVNADASPKHMPGACQPEPEPESESESESDKIICIKRSGDFSENTGTGNENELFEQFWKAFPRKDDEDSARVAFSQALDRASAETIIQGAIRYAEACKAEEREITYIKGPAGWLESARWKDQSPRTAAAVDGLTPERRRLQALARRDNLKNRYNMGSIE